MAEKSALPTHEERRAYMRKLKAFRESLSPSEQRMLDAVVVASYWPTSGSDVQGYTSIVPPYTIYDESTEPRPFELTPWGKVFTYI
jgi:hypothetical protein